MELELKHIAAYLPYGLEMVSDINKLELIGVQGKLMLLN